MKVYNIKFSIVLAVFLLLIQQQVFAGFTLLQSQPTGLSTNTPTPVTFVATITPSSTLIKDSVNLLRQTPEGMKVVGKMHDDGRFGDEQADDNQYTLNLTLNEGISGPIVFQASAAYKRVLRRDFSAPLTLQVQFACGPTGNVMPVKIFEGTGGGPQSQSVDFNVPKGGQAFLRLVNGARLNAPVAERIAETKIAVNGKLIKTFAKDNNVSEVAVDLAAGHNVLEVQDMVAKTGQRLSARIDACADKLVLKPVPDTQKLGGTLATEATLTGLGIPVPNATISFVVSGLGNMPKQTVSTGDFGEARTILSPFIQPGSGSVTATTVIGKPLVSDAIAINVVDTPLIAVRQGSSNLRIKVNTPTSASFFVDLFQADNLAYETTFEQIVEPNDGGITLTPNSVQSVVFEARQPGQETRPRVKEIPITINTIRPGHYTVTSRVTFKVIGETASSVIGVDVLPATDTLVLSTPTVQPGSIPIATSTRVIFQAQASGISKPPVALNIQECAPALAECSDDPNDASWKPIGDLLDNGQGPDSSSGDGVYSLELQLTGKAEGQLLYRVTVKDNVSSVVSKATILQVSRFPVGTDATPPEIVSDPANGIGFVAENVLVSFLPATSPDRIEQIVSQITRTVTGHVGSVTGQVPEIGLLQVKLFVDANLSKADRAKLVSTAINQLKSYDEVRYAESNLVISLATTPDDGGIQQWGVPRIHADRAWDAVTTTKPPGQYANGSPVVVAIVDTGVRETHQDLSGQFAVGSEFGDQYTENGGPGPGHGTGVAAVIAAKHDGVGISGVAYGAQIYSVKGVVLPSSQNPTGGTQIIPQIEGAAGIIRAAQKQEVKVINLSWNQIGSVSGNEPLSLKCALQYATATTIPSVCTQAWVSLGVTPTGNGAAKLVVSAAGNDGIEIPNAVNPNDSRYPCSWDGLVLCVGNTSVNPASETGSYQEPEVGGTNILHTTIDPNPFNTNSCAQAVNFPSNKGDAVDIYAPGTCIYTAKNTGDADYSRRTGTSFSAPEVSGAAAVVWAEMGINNTNAQQVRNQLIQCSKPLQIEGKPFLDLFKAVSQKAHINLVSGEADFKSLFGVYVKDPSHPNNEPKARIVHNIQTLGGGQVTNTFNDPNRYLYLTKTEKDNVEYFLIPNGANLNNRPGDKTSNLDPYVEADLTVGTVQQGSATVYCLKSNGSCLNGQGALAYFSEVAKNPDGQVHLKDLNGQPVHGLQNGQLRWEDLPISSSAPGDFNDAIISIDINRDCP